MLAGFDGDPVLRDMLARAQEMAKEYSRAGRWRTLSLPQVPMLRRTARSGSLHRGGAAGHLCAFRHSPPESARAGDCLFHGHRPLAGRVLGFACRRNPGLRRRVAGRLYSWPTHGLPAGQPGRSHGRGGGRTGNRPFAAGQDQRLFGLREPQQLRSNRLVRASLPRCGPCRNRRPPPACAAGHANVERAFHSDLVRPVVAPLRQALDKLEFKASSIAVPANLSRHVYPVAPAEQAGKPLGTDDSHPGARFALPSSGPSRGFCFPDRTGL